MKLQWILYIPLWWPSLKQLVFSLLWLSAEPLGLFGTFSAFSWPAAGSIHVHSNNYYTIHFFRLVKLMLAQYALTIASCCWKNVKSPIFSNLHAAGAFNISIHIITLYARLLRIYYAQIVYLLPMELLIASWAFWMPSVNSCSSGRILCPRW